MPNFRLVMQCPICLWGVQSMMIDKMPDQALDEATTLHATQRPDCPGGEFAILTIPDFTLDSPTPPR
jgi:hypothetical protein